MAHKLPHPCHWGQSCCICCLVSVSLMKVIICTMKHWQEITLYSPMRWWDVVPHSDISQLDKRHLLIALHQNPNWHSEWCCSSTPPSPPPCLTWHHPILRSAKQPHLDLVDTIQYFRGWWAQLSYHEDKLPELQKDSILLLKGSVPSYSAINSPNPKTSSPHPSFKCPTVTFKCSVRPPHTACVSATVWCG
jgi:hypothetical protein